MSGSLIHAYTVYVYSGRTWEPAFVEKYYCSLKTHNLAPKPLSLPSPLSSAIKLATGLPICDQKIVAAMHWSQ